MSYDLLVFEPGAAPSDRTEFLNWYDVQTDWKESHDYNDPAVSTPAIQGFYRDLIKQFPPMNGPHATEHIDDENATDYSVGKVILYAAFSFSVAEVAYTAMVTLARQHGLGFFDVSADNGEIILP